MAGGRFSEAIKNGEFIVTAEVRPPKGADVSQLKTSATTMNGALSAVYVPESEDGVRLSSFAACSHLAAAGGEPILALLTRDLNRIALQSTLLGAASMGVKNVLCIVGRHQALTSAQSAKGVFDVDPAQLIKIADGMRKDGILADGTALDAPVDLVLGVDTNPFSDPTELQVIALEKAVNAGADFVVTQPVFNLDRFNIWMSYVRERNLHTRACIIASVMPLESAQDAVRLAQKYTHLDIRDEDVQRLNTAQDQKAAGIHLAAETIKYLRGVEGVRGIHLMTGDDIQLAAELIKTTGLSRS